MSKVSDDRGQDNNILCGRATHKLKLFPSERYVGVARACESLTFCVLTEVVVLVDI